MAKSFDGRVVLITGGGSGFGRAAALQFAAEGGRIVIGDLNRETADATASAARKIGGDAAAFHVDVTSEESVETFHAAAVKQFGRIDCTFNNAGVLGPVSDLHTYPMADYDRVMTVNVKGVWLCMQAQITQMLKQDAPKGGHSIVNTASAAGLSASPLLPAYCASKHAVVGLTKTAARQYGRKGIRINCVCPGPVETPLAGPLFDAPGQRERMRLRQCMDNFGTPDEVAALVVWMSSPAASLVTGTPMRVDAGALT